VKEAVAGEADEPARDGGRCAADQGAGDRGPDLGGGRGATDRIAGTGAPVTEHVAVERGDDRARRRAAGVHADDQRLTHACIVRPGTRPAQEPKKRKLTERTRGS
jgi:hypothetical protein